MLRVAVDWQLVQELKNGLAVAVGVGEAKHVPDVGELAQDAAFFVKGEARRSLTVLVAGARDRRELEPRGVVSTAAAERRSLDDLPAQSVRRLCRRSQVGPGLIWLSGLETDLGGPGAFAWFGDDQVGLVEDPADRRGRQHAQFFAIQMPRDRLRPGVKAVGGQLQPQLDHARPDGLRRGHRDGHHIEGDQTGVVSEQLSLRATKSAASCDEPLRLSIDTDGTFRQVARQPSPAVDAAELVSGDGEDVATFSVLRHVRRPHKPECCSRLECPLRNRLSSKNDWIRR
jgi:hypothetical protein